MKFKLFPSVPPGDPFGDGDRTIVVNIPDKPPASSSFRFALENTFLPPTPALPSTPGDPFGSGDGDGSKPFEFAKINLVPGRREDPFAGLGASSERVSGARFSFPELNLTHTGRDTSDPFDSAEERGAFKKSAETGFHKFAQFTKVQETGDGNVLVWGIATLEQPDMDSEICDYDAAKSAYQAWSLAAAHRTSNAGQQISLGPIRYQHSIEPAGKATKIEYNDDAKEVWLGSVPINEEVRNELQQGFLTGYSQGGSYAWRKCADCGKSLTLQQANNYCPACKKQVQVLFGLKRLSEVSYVDSPCTGKGFEYIKADGSREFVNFAKHSNRSSLRGATILSTERIYREIWKSVVMVGDRKRTVVHWPEGHVVL